MTADIAEMHLAVRPDGDVALFNGLLAWLADHDALDRAYIAGHTSGFDDAFAAASAMSFDEIAEQTGVAADELRAFYALFARTEKVVTVYSQGVNQSSAGTDKVNAIINCHFATGRIGRAGMGPFSVTGQPNAMGGARGRRPCQHACRAYGDRKRRTSRLLATLLARTDDGRAAGD